MKAIPRHAHAVLIINAAVNRLKTDSVPVTCTCTQYNHQGRLRFNNDTTRIVAEKLKQSSRIVEDVRDTGTAQGICRKDLISEKDVNNIKKRF